MARTITGSVKAVQVTLTALADECVTSIERGLAAMAAGDLTVEAHANTPRIAKYGSDEVGQTARVTNAVLDKMEATIASYEEARTKLAARSQRETRAISELIRDVQAGTRDAVQAMETVSGKVGQGTAKAYQAGAALTEILDAVEAMVERVTTIATAAQEMTGASRGVVDAMASISAIVEESSAATEEMAAQAGQVSESIQSIASAAEQSSGATRQVSASSEEMAAQVADVSEQAEVLARTAAEVRALLAQFRVDSTTEQEQAADPEPVADEPAAEPTVMARRRDDWRRRAS